MYKNRNTGTGNGMRGMQGMGGMLYSRECHQSFQGMSRNIPGNAAKHSGESPQTFQGMSPNIVGNVAKHSGVWQHSPECLRRFPRMFGNIPGMFEDIPWNVAKHSKECHQTFQGIL